jgi:hypothetical protein
MKVNSLESSKILEKINEAKVQDITITTNEPNSPKSPKNLTPQKSTINASNNNSTSNNTNNNNTNNRATINISNVSGESNTMDVEQNIDKKRKLELKVCSLSSSSSFPLV